MTSKFYITTAIDYVNAEPHIGHAYEKIFADIIARWHRLRGEDVFFLTGTDENAQKNVKAAEQAGKDVRSFVDSNAMRFLELAKKLNLSNNDFIRTTEERHVKAAQELFKLLHEKGYIYKGTYRGLYCYGCEAYLTEKDLVDGKCPEHKTKPDYIEEPAYFFRLSEFQDKIKELLKKGFVVPREKANEMLARLNEPLKDLCVSRYKATWGIPVPFDSEHRIYVWIDALSNYISALGWPNNDKFKKYWPADLHVIGKGINWFHSVIWPALLLAAGIELPKRVLVHGYINIKGAKMSKTEGNVVSPFEIIDKYGTETLRYYLAKMPYDKDSDFSEQELIARHNDELADKLGNLISRVSAMIERYGMKQCENKLVKKLDIAGIEKDMEEFRIDKALAKIFNFVDECNLYIQEKKPWETHDACVLYELADSIKAIAILLWPFLPATSEKIAHAFGFEITYKQLNSMLSDKVKIKKTAVLFKKIYNLPSETNKEKQSEVKNKKMGETIKFKEWQKLDLRVGKIINVQEHENADKLYILEVDLGSERRKLVAGLKPYYKPEELLGKLCVVFCNLEPAVIRGVKSEGMILAAVSEDSKHVVLLQPEKDIELGSKIA